MTVLEQGYGQPEFCANPNCWLHHYRGEWGSGGSLSLTTDYIPASGEAAALPTQSHFRHFQVSVSGVKCWVCDSCLDFDKAIDLASLLAQHPKGFAIGHGGMVRPILLATTNLEDVRGQYATLPENGLYLVVEKLNEQTPADGLELLADNPSGFSVDPAGDISGIIQATPYLALVAERNPIPPARGCFQVVAPIPEAPMPW